MKAHRVSLDPFIFSTEPHQKEGEKALAQTVAFERPGKMSRPAPDRWQMAPGL